MEIIVPLFPSLDPGVELRRAWPDVRFVDIAGDPPQSPGLEHWKYDRRRAAGLGAARGDVIALTEDRTIPGNRWCSSLWATHQRESYAVIGSGIDYFGQAPVNRAAFYCDFGRYQPPFQAAQVEFLSAANVAYKRSILENCRSLWKDFYDESEVHRHIRGAGGSLYLTPESSLSYGRGSLAAGLALRQKRASGRVFAGRRAQSTGVRRWAYAAMAPALAPLMLIRMLLLKIRRGHALGPFLSAAPFTLLCLLSWSLGEFTGYVTARPFPAAAQDGSLPHR